MPRSKRKRNYLQTYNQSKNSVNAYIKDNRNLRGNTLNFSPLSHTKNRTQRSSIYGSSSRSRSRSRSKSRRVSRRRSTFFAPGALGDLGISGISSQNNEEIKFDDRINDKKFSNGLIESHLKMKNYYIESSK